MGRKKKVKRPPQFLASMLRSKRPEPGLQKLTSEESKETVSLSITQELDVKTAKTYISEETWNFVSDHPNSRATNKYRVLRILNVSC